MNKFATLYTPSHGPTAMLGWPALGEMIFVAPVTALARLLLTWQTRLTDREGLAGMSRHQLDDIAIDRADALRESWKPFWTA